MNNEPAPPYDLPKYDSARDAPVRYLRRRLKALFPKDVRGADIDWKENWSIPICGSWVMHFANQTKVAFRNRDEALALSHLNFFSDYYRRAGKMMKGVIDVNYVEDIFYDVDEKSQVWAWRLFPDNLKELYVGVWGTSKMRGLDSGSL